MCDWVTLLYSGELTEYCKPDIMKKTHCKIKKGAVQLKSKGNNQQSKMASYGIIGIFLNCLYDRKLISKMFKKLV